MSRRWLTLLIVAACSSPGLPDADVARDAAPDAATCGVRSGQRGKTSRALRAAGIDRTYIVYLPASLDPRTPVPLVFVHHGYTMSAQAMFDVAGFVLRCPQYASATALEWAFFNQYA